MATSSARTDPSSDALSRLRIQRAEPGRKSSWSKWLFRMVLGSTAVLGVAVVAFVLAYKNGGESPGTNWLTIPEIMRSRIEVRVAQVTVESGRSADATVVATGFLESRWQAKIGARTPGRVEIINVEEGSRVKAGQVLAVLEHADLEASLAAVEATLTRAEAALNEQEVLIRQSQRELDRAERLWKAKGVAESNYDEAKFKYESAVARRASLAADIALAEARGREARQMKENMFIRAPFDGTVISKDAEVGESILPGGMGEASGRDRGRPGPSGS